MGLLDKLFGGRGGSGGDAATAETDLFALYDDPEAKSEGGLPLQSRQADELRALGRRLHKAGGKERMQAAREALRERHPWAASNLDAIWSSLAEWRD